MLLSAPIVAISSCSAVLIPNLTTINAISRITSDAIIRNIDRMVTSAIEPALAISTVMSIPSAGLSPDILLKAVRKDAVLERS